MYFKLILLTHSVERVVAATAKLVTTLRAAEMHAASFRQRVLKATVRTGWKRGRKRYIRFIRQGLIRKEEEGKEGMVRNSEETK